MNIQFKKYSIIFFPGKFNSKIDSKFLIWLDSIQWNIHPNRKPAYRPPLFRGVEKRKEKEGNTFLEKKKEENTWRRKITYWLRRKIPVTGCCPSDPKMIRMQWLFPISSSEPRRKAKCTFRALSYLVILHPWANTSEWETQLTEETTKY